MRPGGACAVFAVVLAGAVLALAGRANAQPGNQVNPVYVDVTPAGAETMVRVREHLAAGNLDEAVRVLQQMLETEPYRMLSASASPVAGIGAGAGAAGVEADLFLPVRRVVHDLLNARPELLERYRQVQSPRAARLLEQGETERVWRAYLLTEAGFEAALRRTQSLIEDARFESARQVLEELEGHPDRAPGAAKPELAHDASQLMHMVAAYLDRPVVWERAERWSLAAATPARRGVRWPAGAGVRGRTPLDEAPAISREGLISRPLSTAVLRPEAVARDETDDPEAKRAAAARAAQERRMAGRVNVRGGMRDPRLMQEMPLYLADLSILPAATDTDVFVNDGSSITAFDRFTLRPRWSASPGVGADPAMGGGVADPQRNIREMMLRSSWMPRVEEPSLVTSFEGLVVACTGRGMAGGRGGDYVVTALDARTGALRWSVELSELDPALADCACRGPVLISEGRVVVTARKYLPERRLTALFLAAIDARDGTPAWVRTIGSTGSLPHFGGAGNLLDATIGHRGVVYRVDELGVLGAYRAVDGQALWLRTMPREAMQSIESARAWELNTPFVVESDGGRVVAAVSLSPDRREILRVSLEDGRVLGRRSSDILGVGTMYLLRAGDRLLGVGKARLGSVDLATFETVNTATFSGPPGSQVILTGRVAVSGHSVMAPTPEGVLMLDARDLASSGELVRLDAPGNLLPLESQLLVVDDARLHSYLLWDVASAMLRKRLADDPLDAGTAVTLAELAYRAGRSESILEGVDAALAAMDRAAKAGAPGHDGVAQRAVRRRLYVALDAMLTRTLEEPRSWVAGTTSPNAGRSTASGGEVLTDAGLIEALVDRLGRVASDPGERAGHLLASGRFAEGLGRVADAAARYQRVLDEQDLAASTWEGPRVRVPAHVEAARRVIDLVSVHGLAAYAVHERDAGAALEALPEDADPAMFTALAERYPVGAASVQAWLKAGRGSMRRAASDASARVRAISAFERGLETARATPSGGVDAALTAAVGGELAWALLDAGHERRALGVLDEVQSMAPGLAMSATKPDGTERVLDAAEVRSRVGRAISERSRWARIGGTTGSDAQALAGHALMEPMIRDRTPAVHRMFATRSERHVALWAPDPDSPSGAVTRVWQRTIDEQSPTLVRIDGDSAYFAFVGTALTASSRPRATLERVRLIAPDRAETAWRTDEPGAVFEEAEGVAVVQGGVSVSMFMTPGGRAVDKSDMTVVMDERTIVFVQRGGRAAAFDTADGQRLWSTRTNVSRVYDLDLAGSHVVIAGDEEVYSTGGRVIDLRGVIQIVDARTGSLRERLIDQGGCGTGGHPRWVRALQDGGVVVGLNATVVRLDPWRAGGRPVWVIAGPEGMAPVVDAWIVEPAGSQVGAAENAAGGAPGVIVMQSQDRVLYMADLRTGRLRAEPLDAPRTHVEGSRPLRVSPTGPSPAAGDGLAVSTFQGMLVYGINGELRGVDALGGFESMLAPVMAQGRAVTVETVSEGPTPDGLMMFSLYQMDTRNARMIESTTLVLGAKPEQIELLDGRIAVSAGAVTVVLRAPARE